MAIEWTPDLATGIDEIDAQHRELYALVNDLHRAMRAGRLDDVPGVIAALARYAQAHFDAEEGHMRAAGYPGLAEHAAHHATFLSEFSRLEAVCAPGRPRASAVVELSEFLGRWLREHVRRVDREMGRALRSPGAAGRALAECPDPGCLLDAGGVIRSVNPAWDAFARANGGAPAALGAAVVGTRWLDHVAGDEVRAWYAGRLEAALGGEPGAAVVSLGECNSADTVRLVSTRLERVAVPDLPGAVGVAVTSRTLRETPARYVRAVIDGDAPPYRNPDGTVVQCAICRRTRRPGFSARPAWEFVPSLIRSRPGGLAFAFCEGCEGHYLRSAS